MPTTKWSLGDVEIQQATPQLHPSLLDKASEEGKLTREQGSAVLPKTQKLKSTLKTQQQNIKV